MSQTASTDDYLEAFLNGLEFALLAAEGRLTATPELRAFVDDYRRVLTQYRARRECPPPELVRLLGRVIREADIEPLTRN